MVNDFDSDYIDFLIELKSFLGEKCIIKSSVEVNRICQYEAHVRVCRAVEGFEMPLVEDGWVVFIFEDEVFVHKCPISDKLMTIEHEQIISN